MKIILEAEGVKRELVGPFRFAMSRRDLETLRTQLENISFIWEKEHISYSWAQIFPAPVDAGPASEPLPWAQR